jgi:hypothetical protein
MNHATEHLEAAPASPPAAPAQTGDTGAAGATGSQGGALTQEQLVAITLARRQGRKVSRAATVATISGWTLAFFSFISVLMGLFSLVSLLLGVGLGIVAYFELKGAKGLRQLDDAAPRRLGINQIALGVMIAVYCCWGIWMAVLGPGPYDSYYASGGDTAEMIQSIDRLNRAMTTAFYTLLICVCVIAQGCTSWYYFTRRRHMIAYLTKTPAWVIEALRVAAH